MLAGQTAPFVDPDIGWIPMESMESRDKYGAIRGRTDFSVSLIGSIAKNQIEVCAGVIRISRFMCWDRSPSAKTFEGSRSLSPPVSPAYYRNMEYTKNTIWNHMLLPFSGFERILIGNHGLCQVYQYKKPVPLPPTPSLWVVVYLTILVNNGSYKESTAPAQDCRSGQPIRAWQGSTRRRRGQSIANSDFYSHPSSGSNVSVHYDHIPTSYYVSTTCSDPCFGF
jgi:hypothetical protein